MMVTAFFSPLLPLSLLWAFISLIVIYWFEKYKLLNSCSVDKHVGNRTTLVMCNMIDYFLPIYVFGYTIFSYIATGNEFIHYAMHNIDGKGNYKFKHFALIWFINDSKKDDSSMYDYETVTMLDSFIKWGIFGLYICIAHFIITYVMDWKSK